MGCVLRILRAQEREHCGKAEAAWPPCGRALRGSLLPPRFGLGLVWESPERGVCVVERVHQLVQEVGYLKGHLFSDP